ncbi:MAG: phenylalanine--tRNA ligase subunit beta [bacterium]
MLYSRNWLKQYLPETDFESQDFRSLVTNSLAEVEDIQNLRAEMEKVIVGEIVDIKDHPSSKKLHIVTVDVIKGTNDPKDNLVIVCGAPNVEIGKKVAVCLVGGSVMNAKYDGTKDSEKIMKIERREILGEMSNGMICSAKELGISEEHDGILILPEESIVGSDLVELLKDQIIEIENKSFTHRPDCFCHRGVARELSAITKSRFIDKVEIQLTLKAENAITIDLKTTNCKRYSALTISNVKVKESPFWLQMKLLSVGVRPINNVVDATNYIMLDIGQPMHAFDFDKIKSNKIVVREANEGEKFTTLDSKERTLKKGMMVIATEDKPLAIAGVMGGMESEISNDTVNILLESANFNKDSIRDTSRELGLRTEASTRYEKGLDSELTMEALKHATSLITELAGGDITSEFTDNYNVKEDIKIVEVNLNKIKSFLGISLKKEEVVDILNRLNINTEHSKFVSGNNPNEALNSTYLNLIIPTYRKDLNIEADIMEEIARIYGYDKLNPTLPVKSIKPFKVNKVLELQRYTVNYLMNYDFNEIYSYSFVSTKLWEKCGLDTKKLVRITNAISPELEYARNSLIPSLLEKVNQNLEEGNNLNFFEISRIILKEKSEENIPLQPWTLGIVMAHEMGENNLIPEIATVIFNYLKKLNITYKVVNLSEYKDGGNNSRPELFAPKQTAVILNEENKVIGLVGKLNPRINVNFKLENKDVYVAQIDLEVILKTFNPDVINYKPLSIYQENFKDISLGLKENIESQKIIDKVKSEKIDNLDDIYLIDRFVKDELTSLTLRLEIESDVKTLSEGEIKKCTDKVNEIISKNFSVTVR